MRYAAQDLQPIGSYAEPMEVAQKHNDGTDETFKTRPSSKIFDQLNQLKNCSFQQKACDATDRRYRGRNVFTNNEKHNMKDAAKTT